jgi:hypothetical protein
MYVDVFPDPEGLMALLRQTGIGVAMHGYGRLGLMGCTSPVAASHPLASEQPAETGHLMALEMSL